MFTTTFKLSKLFFSFRFALLFLSRFFLSDLFCGFYNYFFDLVLRRRSLSLVWTFAQSSLVRTGDEAFYRFVLMRVDLPRCVTVDLTVDGQVPSGNNVYFNKKKVCFVLLFKMINNIIQDNYSNKLIVVKLLPDCKNIVDHFVVAQVCISNRNTQTSFTSILRFCNIS